MKKVTADTLTRALVRQERRLARRRTDIPGIYRQQAVARVRSLWEQLGVAPDEFSLRFNAQRLRDQVSPAFTARNNLPAATRDGLRLAVQEIDGFLSRL